MATQKNGEDDPWEKMFAKMKGDDGGDDTASNRKAVKISTADGEDDDVVVPSNGKQRHRKEGGGGSKEKKKKRRVDGADAGADAGANTGANTGADIALSPALEAWLNDSCFANTNTSKGIVSLDLKKAKRDGSPFVAHGFEGARSAVRALWDRGPSRAGDQPNVTPIVKVSHFLPPHIADEVLSVIENCPGKWEIASTTRDSEGGKAFGAGSAKHRYDVGDGGDEESVLGRCLTGVRARIEALLADVAEGSFQASRYGRGHFIEPHDDFARKEERGRILRRDIAVVFYLTKDWGAEDGGSFCDMVSGREYVPEFNSVVAFRVPRLHSVTPVQVDRPRFAMFGWFYRNEDECYAKKKKKKKKSKSKNKE